jgi:hypothetical protein
VYERADDLRTKCLGLELTPRGKQGGYVQMGRLDESTSRTSCVVGGSKAGEPNILYEILDLVEI